MATATARALGDYERLAAELSLPTLAFIDGRQVPAHSGQTFTSVSARDGRPLAEVAACNAVDVDDAVSASRRAFESGVWSRRAPRDRGRVLRRFAELIAEHADELALLDSLNVGKPIERTIRGDIVSTLTCMEYFSEAVDKHYGQVAPTRPGTLALITHEPYGVVGAVIPWNYPLLMAAWKLGPSLAVGNSVVLKPAEQSPFSALRLAELADEAGIPAGVLNVVPGLGETAGQAIGRHMDVDKLAFTGSTEVGKLFLRYSGESNMKSLSLECGGKSPHIVLGDVGDLSLAARNVADGIFTNSGQVCNAGTRLLVEESVAEELVERVVEHARALQVGDPLDPTTEMGPVVDQTQLRSIVSDIDGALASGATPLVGGGRILEDTGGAYVAPTVLGDVRPEMDVAQKEVFGPVLSVLKFKTADEAIQLANATTYGLAAALWTDNVHLAHEVSTRLRAGTVWVNCFDTSDITVPFGGVRQSGFGRDKSMLALEQYSQPKTTWMEMRTPWA